MSDRFRPISLHQLTDWAATELARKDSLFNVPRRAFFEPRDDHWFRRDDDGQSLETPFGVAAGPHTQMAQNIVTAWLVGARMIELKTVQTLDELDVSKPCIDVEDEGYNVEWSQELRIGQSFEEYLRAWILIHALHRSLGWPGDRPGVSFNMSVGYNLEGIRQPNVQWYLDAMADASSWLPEHVEIVARRFPAVREVQIPSRLSDTVTLSTMHGCPPDEIERISTYLIEERGLHTWVKCNPTLLGADRVRRIVNGDLGFADVPIPDEAFGHDLKWADAIPMFRRLRQIAEARGRTFGLKLSNTLEVDNWRAVFERDPRMYMSGRPLHAVTTSLAAALSEELGADVPISFAGGADCFNVASLIAGGVRSVTVCSDLLKTGGYLRMLQYREEIEAAFSAVGATDTDSFVRRTAQATGFAGDTEDVAACALYNLRRHADESRQDWRYQKQAFRTDRSKTRRTLDSFDCIQAPCLDECPVDQEVPRYMAAVRSGKFGEAARITRLDNPLPAVLGRVCDHLCENTCIRTHLDQPLAIRQVKRFIMDHEQRATAAPPPRAAAPRVAIVGAGPAGLAAAESLARAGIGVTVLEERSYAGGMAGGAIPTYRLPGQQLEQDTAILERLGVEFHYGRQAGVDFTIEDLRGQGFGAVFVAIGAQRAKRLGLAGEDSTGVIDGVTFLRSVREGHPVPIGDRVVVVGAGDTAMDCVRTARRVGASRVSLIYRRTIDQMPADREEIHAIREEGVSIVELARPVALRIVDDRLAGVLCRRTEYRGSRDGAGRKVPEDVPGADFEVDADTLILAISQHAVLECFGREVPELTAAGYVAVDPVTFETSIHGVYAGGDVAGRGPASIVQAAADGKRAAAAIAASLGVGLGDRADSGQDPASRGPDDSQALVLRRGHRAWRTRIRATSLDRRDGFEETVLGYSDEEAMREASRCLDCDTMCSLCVGVCPNIALMTYETSPVHADLPVLAVADGSVVATGSTTPFAVEQRLQVAVLTDFCNECGNCVTACPTSGRPYVDKPRLYLDRADFEAQASNAYMLLGADAEGAQVIEARFGGATLRVCVNDRIEYLAPGFTAELDRDTFALLSGVATGAADGERLSVEPAAIMATLLAGITGSLPHLPTAGPPATAEVRAPA